MVFKLPEDFTAEEVCTAFISSAIVVLKNVVNGKIADNSAEYVLRLIMEKAQDACGMIDSESEEERAAIVTAQIELVQDMWLRMEEYKDANSALN